jgi:hypothetical protein
MSLASGASIEHRAQHPGTVWVATFKRTGQLRPDWTAADTGGASVGDLTGGGASYKIR